MKIFVFKTNIKSEEQKEMLKPILNQIKGINRWQVNLEDKDKELRIEGHGIKPETIRALTSTIGIKCRIIWE